MRTWDGFSDFEKKGSRMHEKIKPWYEKKNQYSNPRLRADTPPDIVKLYDEFLKWREEYQRTRDKSFDY